VERIHTAATPPTRRQGFSPMSSADPRSPVGSHRPQRGGRCRTHRDPQYQASAIRAVRQQLESSGVSTNCWSRPWPDQFRTMTCCRRCTPRCASLPILEEVECPLREHERRMREVWNCLRSGPPPRGVSPEETVLRCSQFEHTTILDSKPGCIPGRQCKRKFPGRALRRVRTESDRHGRPLGLAEDVHHTVIADPVARAEVRVGVVIKRAPGDAACVSGIGRELIVYASVAQSVLDQMVGVVRRLRTNRYGR